MKTLRLTALFFAMAALQLPAVAGPVIDQSNPTVTGEFCTPSWTNPCGQMFRSNQANISGAGIYIAMNFHTKYGNGSAEMLKLSVYSGLTATGPTGLIASGTSWGPHPNPGWVDVFWDPVAVTANTQYYLIFQSNFDFVAAHGRSDYAAGNAFLSGSPYQLTGWDLSFRTYYDDSTAQAVPVSDSLGLLAIGIAGLGCTRRKKQV